MVSCTREDLVNPIRFILESSVYCGMPPVYQTDGAAGFDLLAAEHVVIPPGGVADVSLGIRVAIPKTYEMQLRGRSGLAAKHRIILGHIGTIDSDFRGVLKALCLMNKSNVSFTINEGDRIVQGVINRISHATFVPYTGSVEDFEEETYRGSSGFGSTGVNG